MPPELERVSGPECPACGCEDSEILDHQELTARRRPPGGLQLEEVKCSRTRRQCNHCGRLFSISTPWTVDGKGVRA
jgi:hypothetical protein